jgi:hypothetical protein
MQPNPVPVVETQEEELRPRLLRLVDGTAVVQVPDLDEPGGWHSAWNRDEAACHLERLERAAAAGRRWRASRARRNLLSCVQRDRVTEATEIAERAWLPFERVGIGPLMHIPGVFRDVRRTWRVFPLSSNGSTTAPGPAARAKAAWDAHGPIFDRYYLAYDIAGRDDVLNGSATPCLVGVISSDGLMAEWFVLDRWTT